MLPISYMKMCAINKLRQFYFLAERKLSTLVQVNKISYVRNWNEILSNTHFAYNNVIAQCLLRSKENYLLY